MLESDKCKQPGSFSDLFQVKLKHSKLCLSSDHCYNKFNARFEPSVSPSFLHCGPSTCPQHNICV